MQARTAKRWRTSFASTTPPTRHDRKPTRSDSSADGPTPTLPRDAGEGEGGGELGAKGRWRAHTYDDLIARDNASLDTFWLNDDSLADSDNLPSTEVIAQEIADDLEAALEQFRLIAGDLAANESAKLRRG